MVYLKQKRWERKDKIDYYFAQIAAEIRRFRESFYEHPLVITTEDYLLEFYSEEQAPRTTSTEKLEGPSQIELSPDIVNDPKWSKVNDKAKSDWAAMLGLEKLG